MNTPVRIARKRCSSSTAKRGQLSDARPDMQQADDDRAGEQQVRDDPGRAGEVPDRRAHAARRSGTAARQLSLSATTPSRVDEPAGEAAAVEPRRPGRPEQQRRLGGDVGREAGCGGDGHVAPRRAGRPAGARDRSDGAGAAPPRSQVRTPVLLVASPPCVDGDRVAAGQPDRDRDRRREVAAGRHPALPRRRARASSTVRPLTTPFRSSTIGSVRSSIRPRSDERLERRHGAPARPAQPSSRSAEKSRS